MLRQERAAAQKLEESVAAVKRLKAKSQDAKRKVKQAKKTAKQAAKAARAARKESEKARRVYKKSVARAKKARARAAQPKNESIATPRKPARSRGTPRSPRERSPKRARVRVREVGEDAVHTQVAELTELGAGVPVVGA